MQRRQKAVKPASDTPIGSAKYISMRRAQNTAHGDFRVAFQANGKPEQLRLRLWEPMTVQSYSIVMHIYGFVEDRLKECIPL
eukprot:6179193-Pleurochrysis_carterae.AAC.1